MWYHNLEPRLLQASMAMAMFTSCILHGEKAPCTACAGQHGTKHMQLVVLDRLQHQPQAYHTSCSSLRAPGKYHGTPVHRRLTRQRASVT